MEFTAQQIAQLLEGKVIGNENTKVSTLCKIEEGKEGGLSFLANEKYSHYIYDSSASVVIVNESFKPEREVKPVQIVVKDAYASFAKLLEIYNQYVLNKSGVSSLAFISQSATVQEGAYVGEFAFIGEGAKIGKRAKIYPQVYVGDNVTIGDDVTLFAGVKIYHDCVLGSRCTLHSGVVVGADGFGFAPLADGTFKKIAQIGNVILEDDVEIGANATVDRSTMGSTIVHKGVKLDNLTQVAHNCEVGANTVMSAMSGLAGSTKIGENCFIGGQVGFAGHLTVGNGVKIGAKTGVMSDVKDGETLFGIPSWNAHSYMKSYAYFRRLPDMEKRIAELEKRLKDLEK